MEIADRVVEVAWRGGPLPDDHFQEFGLSFRITDETPDVLWRFPTVQECEPADPPAVTALIIGLPDSRPLSARSSTCAARTQRDTHTPGS